MMKNKQIEIKVRNFRAIKSAEMAIDGITVVTGENGSGKSTLSSLLYHTFRVSNDFELFVKERLAGTLYRYYRVLSEITDELQLIFKKFRKEKRLLEADSRYLFPDESHSLSESLDNAMEYVDEVIHLTENLLIDSQKTDDPLFHKRLNRMNSIILSLNNSRSNTENNDLASNLVDLKNSIKEDYLASIKEVENRALIIWISELNQVFPEGLGQKNFEIDEYGVVLNDFSSKRLLDAQSVQNVIYIDTPSVLDMYGLQRTNLLNQLVRRNRMSGTAWTDLFAKLTEPKDGYLMGENSLIMEDILQGKAYYSKESLNRGFRFRRVDNKEFNLSECAMGLKSFATIQMLLNNGYLDKNTLLIIDEPEVHMHPQWIVEYARMIVMINKIVGVKFFVSSHNPDLVNAIRQISEKENTLDTLSFYLAEKQRDSFEYVYKYLGTEINEIFKSFNIALERIEMYGANN